MRHSDETRIQELEEAVSELQGTVVALSAGLGIALCRLRGLKHEKFDPLDSVPLHEQLEGNFSTYDLFSEEIRKDKDFMRGFKDSTSSLITYAKLNS